MTCKPGQTQIRLTCGWPISSKGEKLRQLSFVGIDKIFRKSHVPVPAELLLTGTLLIDVFGAASVHLGKVYCNKGHSLFPQEAHAMRTREEVTWKFGPEGTDVGGLLQEVTRGC